jgi:acetolactate synthase-1/2/3 large subunit
MAGAGLYWGHGEAALVALAEELRTPVFVNGLARGCIPADHELAFSRARRTGLSGADVAVLIGAPLDFRLAFGAAFASDADVVTVDVAEPDQEPPRPLTAELYGALPTTLDALRQAARSPDPPQEREAWIRSLRAVEDDARAGEAIELTDDRAPLHPMRVYGELIAMLERDAIVIGDGGDFVSYAGRLLDSHLPGCWLDPGPLGCLGCGPGYALAAKLARPERQVVLLLGDGAFGFSGMEFDTLARHGVAVLGVIGNNGIWALEKHPMEMMYGYSVAAELRPETRYDQIAQALGCHGELVRTPAELRPALDRALASGGPALVNVLTDPSVAYPRRSNLA